MADSSRQLLIKRLGTLKTERASWWAHWKELSDYLLPRSGRFFVQDRDKGQRRHNAIYDSTGTRAARTLAAGMMAGMTSPARPWFRLATPDKSLESYAPVKQWLFQTTRAMQDVFERSNTYRTLHQLYEELGVFGTAATVVLEDYQSVVLHYPVTVGEFCVAQDYRGSVDTLYREFQKTVGQMVDEFGIDAVSPTVKSLFDRGNLEAWVTVVHAIEPRRDRDPRARDAKNMPWRSIYFEYGAGGDKLLRESGFKRFPALVPRWATAGGDIYGNSPGMEALGDVKQLQQEQLRKSQGIDYKTNPPLQVPASMKNRDVERLPGGVSYVDATTAQAGIRTAFEVNLDLSHLLQDIQDVRQRINGAFYADLFLMLANSTDPRMTATEVAERHEEKMLMLGPVVERLNNELLNPLIDTTFDRMLAAGIVPPPPPELHGQDLQVEYTSMLAQAQRAIASNSVDRFVSTLGQVAQIKPEVLDKLDADAWADAYADMLAIDPELIVASDKVALIRQQRAQAQQQQAQQAQQAQAADSMQKLGQISTQGGASNAGADVMNMFSGYGAPQGGA
ncbi:portal protein [Niveibacterium terrae]|uniref:portal protein n=1 Tax=Niveibacterium terrae TaxID=3373598 RepID=UPI003A8D30AD